jgi:hypothetical protein
MNSFTYHNPVKVVFGLDSISHADAEAAPDPEAAADYARRYARWRLLTDKLGEWAQT